MCGPAEGEGIGDPAVGGQGGWGGHSSSGRCTGPIVRCSAQCMCLCLESCALSRRVYHAPPPPPAPLLRSGPFRPHVPPPPHGSAPRFIRGDQVARQCVKGGKGVTGAHVPPSAPRRPQTPIPTPGLGLPCLGHFSEGTVPANPKRTRLQNTERESSADPPCSHCHPPTATLRVQTMRLVLPDAKSWRRH